MRATTALETLALSSNGGATLQGMTSQLVNDVTGVHEEGRGAFNQRSVLRGYAPGKGAGLGRWGALLRQHTCGDGMMTRPLRQPFVC